MNFFKLSSRTPSALIVETDKLFKNFRFADSFTFEDLSKFEERYLSGQLRPSIKSQPVKAKDASGVKDMVRIVSSISRTFVSTLSAIHRSDPNSTLS